MAVLSFFRGLVKSYRNCLQARKNWCAVAHLSDDQLLDIGLYRSDDKIRAITKSEAGMIGSRDDKLGTAFANYYNEEDGCTSRLPISNL
jgi:uncharacterized protein YjiS (DUF1127 family)